MPSSITRVSHLNFTFTELFFFHWQLYKRFPEHLKGGWKNSPQVFLDYVVRTKRRQMSHALTCSSLYEGNFRHLARLGLTHLVTLLEMSEVE
jgi:hypothetical protein